MLTDKHTYTLAEKDKKKQMSKREVGTQKQRDRHIHRHRSTERRRHKRRHTDKITVKGTQTGGHCIVLAGLDFICRLDIKHTKIHLPLLLTFLLSTGSETLIS